MGKEQQRNNAEFRFAAEPLTPTVGDLQLATNAPEMHELIHEFVDEIDEAISQGGVFTEGLHKMRRKASALLQEINVDRTIPPANKGGIFIPKRRYKDD